jgi:hypothetical protein
VNSTAQVRVRDKCGGGGRRGGGGGLGNGGIEPSSSIAKELTYLANYDSYMIKK